MSYFRDIVGQEQLREHLENAIRMNTVSHAYIINGERDAGKEFIAKTFAMALQCDNRQDTEPCNDCFSCKQALGKNHPDIMFITHEKPGTIGVDDIRRQINADVAIYYGRRGKDDSPGPERIAQNAGGASGICGDPDSHR